MATREAIPWQLAGIRSGFRVLDRVAPWLAGIAALELFIRPLRRSRSSAALLRQATRFRIAVDGETIHGYSWGSGPAVLLVHGWEHDAGAMLPFVEPLLAAGMRVLAIDGPAHGRSSGQRADLLRFSAAIRATVDQSGPLVAIIAHSFGASSTLWMLSQPDAPQIARTVLISGPSDVSSQLHFFADTVALPPRSLRALHQSFRRRFGRAPEDVSLSALAVQIDTQALVIHDRQDRRVAFSHSEQIVAAWSQARLLATSGLGHNRILRDPDVVAQASRFVAAAAVAVEV